MKLTLAWLLGVATAAGMAYAYDSYRPSLPYTEPHRTFTTESGIECAAWAFQNGAAVALCEGQGLVLVAPRRECGLNL